MATVDSNPVVAVAAEEREFRGLLAHASSQAELGWKLQFARRAEIGGTPWILVAHGPGPALAGAALAQVLDHYRPRAVLSTGFCGALDPALGRGDVFVADSVHTGQHTYSALPAPSQKRHARGALLSVDRVAVTTEEKRALLAAGALAVEMEAAAVARQAERCDIPFYCVRVVSDEAAERMPLDFNQYRDREGRFSRARIAAAALLRPSAIAALLRFDARCRQAALSLGEFLADCRF